ncbi:MAG: IclR family transcriptional regulator [Acidimicrobiales bacterium]|jgi:DNA-binding IclR family transcriptional regulator
MTQTVDRAIDIIEFIAEKPRSLGEIATRQRVHKSTALRLLQTLESRGFARRDSKGLYLIGFSMIAASQRALDALDTYGAAHPHLVNLSAELGHTLHLGQLVGDEVLYVDKVEGRGAVKMYSSVGGTAVVQTSGVGKAILAFVEEPLRQRLLEQVTYEAYTQTSITTPEELAVELERTRERGWAEDNGEFEAEINCVAVPIRNGQGLVRNAISLTALCALCSLEALRSCVPVLVATATEISRDCGWTR